MNIESMVRTAHAVTGTDRGILAADESAPTIAKRFATIGLESTEERRRAYREILFTTAGLEKYIGGVILFDETIRQQAARRHAVRASCWPITASCRASRSTPAPGRSPATRTRWSPRAWTGCATASRSTPPWEPASRSGAR